MKMKRFISLLLSALALALSLTGCPQEEKGGALTIKNDTRKHVSGNCLISHSSNYWSLDAGESWNRSVDEDGEYSVSFPSYYDNGQNHSGEEISGSLSGGEEVTLFVSAYVPGLEPLADYARFKNDNPVPVTVYSDSAHQNKIADIAARGASPYLTDLSYYNRNGETHLYLVYHLFGDAEFPYRYDFINIVNMAGETPLPDLSRLTDAEKNRVLTNDAYIIVKNTSTFSLILTSGANEISPLGSSSSVLASGKTGAYRVNAGDASSYQFKQNGISVVTFPSGLSAFSSGKLYALTFSGGSSLSWASGTTSRFISVDGALSYAGSGL
jgi:hypothetical protein